MNLEEINKQYLDIKKKVKDDQAMLKQTDLDIKNAEKSKKQAEKERGRAEKQLEAAKKELEKATTDVDKAHWQGVIDSCTETIKTNNRAIELSNDLLMGYAAVSQSIKQRQGENQAVIGELMDKIKKIPEVASECNRAMKIQADKKEQEYKGKKTKHEEKKNKLEQLKQIINKSPATKKIMKEIEDSSKKIAQVEEEIKEIDQEINKLDSKDPDFKSKKDNLTLEKQGRQQSINRYEANRKTARDTLKSSIDKKYHKEIDELTTMENLDKAITEYESSIEKSESKRKKYEDIRKSLDNEPIASRAPKTSRWQSFKNKIKNIFHRKGAKEPALPEGNREGTDSGEDFVPRVNLEDVMRFDISRDMVKAEMRKRTDEKNQDGR